MPRPPLAPTWLLFLAACVDTAPRPAFAELVRPMLADKPGVAIVIGVIDAGGSAVSGYGTISRDGARAPGGDTVFEIGSITKTFTPTLLARMAERGQEQLDDPAPPHLPAEAPLPARNRPRDTLPPPPPP